jgi:rare lipoprotein A
MLQTSRHRVHTQPRSRTALAMLAVALAGCAAPQLATAPTRAVTVSGPTPNPPSASQPPAAASPTRESAQSTPAPAPTQPGEAMVLIAPLDAAEPAPLVAATDDRTAARSGTPLARGKASWYGPRFHGRRTANGERYDMHALTAAHKTLPFGTRLRVRSVHTGKEVVVRINDRGPYKHQRIIDLSRAAMVALGTLERGVTEVELLRE